MCNRDGEGGAVGGRGMTRQGTMTRTSMRQANEEELWKRRAWNDGEDKEEVD